MKKVISFSLYGDKDLYCLGMIENIDIINEKYSDWQIYIYYHNISKFILNILSDKDNTYLFECKSSGYNWEGMFWRFYPLEDNDIEFMISRDADSRISDREMELINLWIESGKTFHVIRDHPAHDSIIMGGLFGINIPKFRSNTKVSALKSIDYYKELYYKQYPKNINKNPDQIFLKEFIYPLVKDDILVHISLESIRMSKDDILIKPDPKITKCSYYYTRSNKRKKSNELIVKNHIGKVVHPEKIIIKIMRDNNIWSGLTVKESFELEKDCLTLLHSNFECICGNRCKHFPKIISCDPIIRKLIISERGYSLNKYELLLKTKKIEPIKVKNIEKQIDCIIHNLEKSKIKHLDMCPSGKNICVNKKGIISIIDFDISSINDNYNSEKIKILANKYGKDNYYNELKIALIDFISKIL